MPSPWLTPYLRDAFPLGAEGEQQFRAWFRRTFGVEPKGESDER